MNYIESTLTHGDKKNNHARSKVLATEKDQKIIIAQYVRAMTYQYFY